MKITEMKVTVAELTKGYSDDGDGGVFGYDDRLTIKSAGKVTNKCREN